MEKISVIIPVYNSEPYLRKCLDSVANQTYKNLEILLIDDGSTDNSVKICDEYAAKDNRIKIFRKETIGGSGSPCNSQNIGLKNFTGDYVGFCDPDDWMEPKMFETLYNAIKKHNALISVVGYFLDTDTDSIAVVNKKKIPDKLLSPREMVEFTFRRDYYKSFWVPAWNKLYSARIFYENENLLFDTGLRLGFDALFNVSVYLTENCTGIYTDISLYHQYQHNTSIVRSASFEKKMDDFKVFKKIVDILVKNGYEDVSVYVKRFHCFRASCLAEEAIENGNKEWFLKMQDEMKIYLKEYIEINSEYPERIERINGLLDKRRI